MKNSNGEIVQIDLRCKSCQRLSQCQSIASQFQFQCKRGISREYSGRQHNFSHLKIFGGFCITILSVLFFSVACNLLTLHAIIGWKQLNGSCFIFSQYDVISPIGSKNLFPLYSLHLFFFHLKLLPKSSKVKFLLRLAVPPGRQSDNQPSFFSGDQIRCAGCIIIKGND